MEQEQALLVNIGERTYRKYPVNIPKPLNVHFPSEKLALLEEDDGESGDEIVNVDMQNLEDLSELPSELISKEENKPETSVLETIYFEQPMNSYTLYTKLNNKKHFNSVCNSQKQLEKDTGAVMKLTPRNSSLEIRANNPESVIKAHTLILESINKAPELRPTDYQVLNQHNRKLLASMKPTDKTFQDLSAPEPKETLDPYPALKINQDKKRNGYFTTLSNFPQQCIDLLLGNKAQKLKKLKSQLKGSVEYFVNKNKRTFEILGFTQEDVKNGYAAFARLLGTSPKALEAFKNSTSKQEYTHFLAVDLQNHIGVSSLQEEIFGCKIKNLKPEMLVPPTQFHLTLGMLNVESEEQVISLLESCREQVVKFAQAQPLQVTFDKIGHFGKPSATNVISLELKNDSQLQKLREINCLLLKTLYENSIIPESELKTQKINLDPQKFYLPYHLTLAKTSKAKTKLKLDITDLLSRKKEVNLETRIDSLSLLSRTKPSPQDPYPVVYSLKFA
mgnify:CR=1 FL=1